MASAFSATWRTSTLLHLMPLPSLFSVRGSPSYLDGILSQFSGQHIQERCAFDFRVDNFAPFRGFGGVPEVLFDPFVAGDFLDRGGLSDFYLYPRVSDFDM